MRRFKTATGLASIRQQCIQKLNGSGSEETEITCQPCCLADNADNQRNVPTYSFHTRETKRHGLTFHGQVLYMVTSFAFPLVYPTVQTRRRVFMACRADSVRQAGFSVASSFICSSQS
jgi:hypothetical protein